MVGLSVDVGVYAGVGVPVGLDVRVAVGLDVALAVALGVMVRVGVVVRVGVGVTVAVGVGAKWRCQKTPLPNPSVSNPINNSPNINPRRIAPILTATSQAGKRTLVIGIDDAGALKLFPGAESRAPVFALRGIPLPV
jgi:hypothetical protein